MPTLGEVQDRITLDYLNRADLSAEARRSIQSAIRHYERQRFWWNENTTTLSSSAGQTFVSLPTDVLVLDRLEITRNSADFELTRRDFDTLREFSVARTRGFPTDYAIYQNRIELFPIPDSAYTLPCYYLRQLTAMSASSDTNDWLSAAENVIVHHATKLIWGGILRNTQEAANHQAMEIQALSELRTIRDQRVLRAIKATQF